MNSVRFTQVGIISKGMEKIVDNFNWNEVRSVYLIKIGCDGSSKGNPGAGGNQAISPDFYPALMQIGLGRQL